jgi:hypothetical protein
MWDSIKYFTTFISALIALELGLVNRESRLCITKNTKGRISLARRKPCAEAYSKTGQGQHFARENLFPVREAKDSGRKGCH